MRDVPRGVTQSSHVHLPGETTGTSERAPQRMAAPVLAFDLTHEEAQLHAEQAWRQGDRNAKTLVKEADFRMVLVTLRALGWRGTGRRGASVSSRLRGMCVCALAGPLWTCRSGGW